MTGFAIRALELWGMGGATCSFIAGRENQVFKVRGGAGSFALRMRRPGLRTTAELHAELAWLEALDRSGLAVPRPHPSLAGHYLESVDGHMVDMVGWLPGRPLGNSRDPLQLDNVAEVFGHLGVSLAHLHNASDSFQPPDGFTRVKWDREGLLGVNPVWDRFWDNPTLDRPTRDLLQEFRAKADAALKQMEPELDYGLIHADVVRENILVDAGRVQLIDFDDGGYGFRLFDIATALLKNRMEPDYETLKAALIAGYSSIRTLDMCHLDLFLALRAVTYVGWVIARMNEPGASERNTRFIADARACCTAYLR